LGCGRPSDGRGFFVSTSVTAFVLVGLIFAHIGILGLNIFEHPGIASRMLPFGAQKPREPGSPIAYKIAQNLAKKLRLFGWIAFWLQLVLALICGVLLEIATSGRAFSPAAAGGFGDAIYWGVVGFLLLWLAIPLAFYCTRAARKILARPDAYSNKIGVTSFRFLLASLLIGFLGVFIAFISLSSTNPRRSSMISPGRPTSIRVKRKGSDLHRKNPAERPGSLFFWINSRPNRLGSIFRDNRRRRE
jgi:hypothetical protein